MRASRWIVACGAMVAALLVGPPGRGPAGAEEANPLRGEALDLPTVGTVGPLPDPEHRVVVSLTRDGWIRVPGRDAPLSLRDLESWLADRSDAPEHREADGSSRLDIVLDIDARMPWIAGQWLMQTCAHPRVRAWRIWLGARTHDGQGGAVAAMLPKDRGPVVTSAIPRNFLKHKIKVFQLDDPTVTSDLRALYARVLERQRTAKADMPIVFEIVAPPPKGAAVPHGYILGIMDVCLAAGAKSVVFEGAAMPLGGRDGLTTDAVKLRDYLLGLRDKPGAPRIRYGNDAGFLPADGELPELRAQGLRSEPWGATASFQVEVVEEEFEEVPEDTPPPPPPPARRPEKAGDVPEAAQVRAAVEAGLRWLAAHQAPDGRWAAEGFGAWCDGQRVTDAAEHPRGAGKSIYDVGVTGLALMAFLRAPVEPGGRFAHGEVVRKALAWLRTTQDPEGCFGPRPVMQYIYGHAIATLAMVEAYALTWDEDCRRSAQAALDFIALARNPHFAWRYGIKPGDNDTSVTTWMVRVICRAMEANAAAERMGRAAPFDLDEEALPGARAWYDKVASPDTGEVGYYHRGMGSARPHGLLERFPADRTRSMTASGTLARVLMDEKAATSALVRKGLEQVVARLPVWNPASGDIDMYYWYHGCCLMAVAGDAVQRAAWWNAMRRAALGSQRGDTDPCGYQGSWDPVGPWGPDGGRVYSTALMTACLQLAAGA